MKPINLVGIANAKMLFVTVGLLFVMQCIPNGTAIKCYVCDSTINPGCADLKLNASISPEECSLDKTKSLDTWLFELNKFSYFDTGAHKNPKMNCQKVVTTNPETGVVITARFCQLDTGDSNACDILRNKLRFPKKEIAEQANNAKNSKQADGGEAVDDKVYDCSICTEDLCNSSHRPIAASYLALLLMMITLVGSSFLCVF